MESFRTQRIALIVVLIIITTTFNEIKPLSYAQHNNCSSSCGNIHPITFPFRLRTDPPNCGYVWYELSCKDNHTLSLHIGGEEYHVKAINYKSYTIRIVAAVIRKDNCSSIPHLPLSSSDFVNEKPFYSLYETDIRPRQHGGVTRQISETVTFLSCENPARDNPSYIDTSTCINGSDFSRKNRGKNYSYVVHGNGFRFSDLEESCQVYHTALVSPTKNVGSIEEIHDAISNGFEVSFVTALAISDIDTDGCSFVGLSTLYCPRRITLLRVIKLIPLMTYQILQIALNVMYEYTIEVLLPKVGIHISLGTHAMAFQLVLLFGPRTTVGFVIGLIIYKWKRRHLSLYAGIEEFLQRHNNLMPIRYAYSDIKKMTDSFKTKLGEGGFGCVYKGKLRSGRSVLQITVIKCKRC